MAVTAVSMNTSSVPDPEMYGSNIGEAGGEMGKDQFMNLLITQMQNQDPMDPVDNKEMIAQLAQFSSLEQMQSLNNKFESFRANNDLAFASSLLGQVAGVTTDEGTKYGKVSNVSMDNGHITVKIGEHTYSAEDLLSVAVPEA